MTWKVDYVVFIKSFDEIINFWVLFELSFEHLNLWNIFAYILF